MNDTTCACGGGGGGWGWGWGWGWGYAGAYLHSTNSADNISQRQIFFCELRLVLYAYCRNAYAKYINGNQGAVNLKGIFRLPDGNRPKDLSLFHSLTCKNNVILEYHGVWRTYTVSITHG